jgi:hypothetical protein
VSRETSSYVKGMWFVAGRRFILREHGEALLQKVIDAVPEEYREAMVEPMASDWYPEAALGSFLQASREHVGAGTDEGTTALIEGCSLEGIRRFWTIALQVTSTQFAIRMLPATWQHLRRGPGRMDVEIDAERAIVRYTSFPYFSDVNYRLLVLGTLRPLMRISTGTQAQVEILGHGHDWLDAEILFP